MKYDFPQFLKDSQELCKTKDDFIKIISNEIQLVKKIPSDTLYYLDRQLYLTRLEGAKFTAQTGQSNYEGRFHEDLTKLMDKLV